MGITREDQDRLAVESHNRAERATQSGLFKDQIVPVVLKSKKGDVHYATDEHFRPGATMEDLAKLKPVFIKENGTVTAGNASGINDAAAAVVLMEAGAAQARAPSPWRASWPMPMPAWTPSTWALARCPPHNWH